MTNTAVPIPFYDGPQLEKGQRVILNADAPKWLVDTIGDKPATVQTVYGYDMSVDLKVEGSFWYISAFPAYLTVVS